MTHAQHWQQQQAAQMEPQQRAKKEPAPRPRMTQVNSPWMCALYSSASLSSNTQKACVTWRGEGYIGVGKKVYKKNIFPKY